MFSIRKNKATASAVAVACAASGLMVGMSVGATPAASGATTELTVSSTTETSITQDFNPFILTGTLYNLGATSMIYEPLLQFDVADPPKYYDWLATGYTWSNGGKKITFTIRKGVKWTNGSVLTPADVAFTYKLVKSNPAINSGGLNITSVSSSGDTVSLTFPVAEYTTLQQIANVPIVPQSQWASVGKPATYTDSTPIGTGPYEFGSFTSEGVTLTKNPNYWQPGKPTIDKLYFPDYTSSTTATAALDSGALQWAGYFVSNIQKTFINKAPQYRGYYMAASGTVSLEPNLTKWPLNQLPVRQAISDAVGRQTIGTEGESGLENPETNLSGLTLPTFKAWLAPAVAPLNASVSPQVSAAKAVLTKAGYVMGKDGFFQTKSGEELKFTLVDPTLYTDYAEDCAIIAQELKQVGIDASFQGLGVAAWGTDVATGNFQATIHWSNASITPYNLYNGWLNSKLAANPASGDYEQLNSPAMDADLTKLAGAETLAQQKTAVAPIEKYVAANLPVIPLVFAAAWFERNSQQFVGWPTSSNPYESGQPAVPTNEVVVLHLSPRS